MTNNFEELATNILEEIYDAIEQIDTDFVFDCEFIDGVINIELPSGDIYVINKHAPSQKIFISSPITGASYFYYDEENLNWLDDGDIELKEFILEELKYQLDR